MKEGYVDYILSITDDQQISHDSEVSYKNVLEKPEFLNYIHIYVFLMNKSAKFQMNISHTTDCTATDSTTRTTELIMISCNKDFSDLNCKK